MPIRSFCTLEELIANGTAGSNSGKSDYDGSILLNAVSREELEYYFINLFEIECNPIEGYTECHYMVRNGAVRCGREGS